MRLPCFEIEDNITPSKKGDIILPLPEMLLSRRQEG
jgi:hypothetical protein